MSRKEWIIEFMYEGEWLSALPHKTFALEDGVRLLGSTRFAAYVRLRNPQTEEVIPVEALGA